MWFKYEDTEGELLLSTVWNPTYHMEDGWFVSNILDQPEAPAGTISMKLNLRLKTNF